MIAILETIVSVYLIVSFTILSIGSISTLLCLFTCYLEGDNYSLILFPHFLREDEKDNIKWSLSKSFIISFTWLKYPYKLIVSIGKTLEL